MEPVDQREALERLIRERGEDYAGLSRLIGRNPAYIQQFVKRGVPRKLDEADRRLLARYFGISEEELGGPGPSVSFSTDRLIPISKLDVGASAGPGAVAGSELPNSYIAFDRHWLRRHCAGGPGDLSIIRVQGDSMVPGLNDGDDILVDRSDGAQRLRDGIYVLRRDETLVVKRLAINPAARTVTIKSDNPAYPDWPDCDLAGIQIIGRVVWAGRKVS